MAEAEVALTLPFELDRFGNIVVTTNQETIWSNRVHMAVGTSISERVMRPGYGTTIAAALFDTNSFMEETIRREVDAVFNNYLSLLTLVDLKFSFIEDRNELSVEVLYQLPNKSEITTTVVVSNENAPYEELS